MKEVIVHNRAVSKEVSQFRKKFTEMKFCLPEKEAAPLVKKLLKAIR
jgi:hypothetical protein